MQRGSPGPPQVSPLPGVTIGPLIPPATRAGGILSRRTNHHAQAGCLLPKSLALSKMPGGPPGGGKRSSSKSSHLLFPRTLGGFMARPRVLLLGASMPGPHPGTGCTAPGTQRGRRAAPPPSSLGAGRVRIGWLRGGGTSGIQDTVL